MPMTIGTKGRQDAGGLIMTVLERMTASDKVLPDVTALLMEDHRTVEAWMEAYPRLQDPALKANLAKQICAALKAHASAEEIILYPFARASTGDDALIDRAFDEHGRIKDLVASIELADPGGPQMDDLISQLSNEVRLHVVEEEGQLFPELRERGADLYAIGGALAARRAELMAADMGKSTPRTHGPLKPIFWRPDMHQSSTEIAESLFIAGLKDAHAMERQSEQMLELMLSRIEHYPQVRERVAQHLDETKMQLQRLEQIFEITGSDRSLFKDMAMAATGTMGAMANAMAEDEILKNSLASYAQENFEIASYEALITLGQEAGYLQALPLLGKSLMEERAMAMWLADHLREVTLIFLQLRSQGVKAGR
ncbi:DUF892 family protein [Pedomonas mirosovicensis]|uniref:DUF892 family protein n=1 Tax=Pedomonas mirosovicensis TaxID=2908641 RepID=UPI002169D12F|nr:DUF892 family protein [Pedomonas mirosovicensis]MCH8686498.1 DUF892 family protein [Pedomonas mirosovicensis]